MQRLGIAFSGGPNPAEIVECVKLAEALGYESAWMAEGHGGDQFAVLAACATQTSRILLGTSITSVFVRTVPTIAMAAATVDHLSAGRFILGIGSSHKVQVEGEHGMPYAKVRIDGFDLWFTPRRPAIPIYVSAVFPKMIALCGEIADGVILTRSTLRTAAAVRAQLAEGAKRAGRDPARVTLTTLLPTAVGQTRREALDVLRPGLAFYAGFFPRYNRMMAEHGFADEAAAIAEAWSRGDREAAERAVSDALIDATSIAGTPDECRDRIEAYRQSGIDLPILSPFARGADAKARFEAVIRACAPTAG